MNVVLVVIDSLRKQSLLSGEASRPRTPFLDRLEKETVSFERAYSSECWTLPSHLSMFTGLLPSEHKAHFQTMAYEERAPTIAEELARAGFATELITRNSIFDGSLPGVTRGFSSVARPLREISRGLNPLLPVLALAKPRVRRLIRSSGFFHSFQKENASFLLTLARMGLPADELALGLALERMATHRGCGKPYFLFLNLYDVHAPYSPSEYSPLRPLDSVSNLLENLSLPWVLPKVSSHAYLRPGFHLSDRSRQMLLARYHRAIELMDRRLERFFEEATRGGLLDETLVVITSDHGEAFGEHGLYLHDASVYDTHLHVPLWIHYPELPPTSVDEVVSTRDLHGLVRSVALGSGVRGTILDSAFRDTQSAALAEHFHYPHTDSVLERYRVNLAAAVVRDRKLVRRGLTLEEYDLRADPGELSPAKVSVSEVEPWCRRAGLGRAATKGVLAHLSRPRAILRRAA